jgi:uncharacterized protein YecT (DUF1311 family)
MLHKAFGATLLLLLMTGVVSAQIPTPGVHLNEDHGKRPRTKEQQEYDKALDRAYQDATKEIPEAKKKSDPWGDIRSTSPASAKNKY